MFKTKHGYKVPFRQCYAQTFWGWIKYTLWCHIGIKFKRLPE